MSLRDPVGLIVLVLLVVLPFAVSPDLRAPTEAHVFLLAAAAMAALGAAAAGRGVAPLPAAVLALAALLLGLETARSPFRTEGGRILLQALAPAVLFVAARRTMDAAWAGRARVALAAAVGAVSIDALVAQHLGVSPVFLLLGLAHGPIGYAGAYTLGGEARALGALANPNTLAAYLVTALPLLLGGAAAAQGRGRRAALLSTATLAFLALLPTASRTGLVALAAGAAVGFFASAPRPRRVRHAAAALAAAAVLGEALATPDVAAMLFDPSHPRTADRLLLWRAALDAVALRPWAGHGLGAFGPVFAAFGDPKWFSLRGDAANVTFQAHSEWLDAAVAGGLPLLALLAAGAVAVAAAGRRRLLSLEGARRDLAAGALGALTAALAVSLLNSNVRQPVVALGILVALWTLFPAPAVAARTGDDEASPAPGVPLLGAAFGLAASLFLLVSFAQRLLVGEAIRDFSHDRPAAAVAAEAALLLDPADPEARFLRSSLALSRMDEGARAAAAADLLDRIPWFAESARNASVAATALGDHRLAVRALRHTIRRRPTPELRLALGKAAFRAGGLSTAEAALRRARSDGAGPEVLQSLGAVAAARGDEAEARSLYLAAAAQGGGGPATAAALWDYGLSLLRTGETTAAAAIFEWLAATGEAGRLHPASHEALRRLSAARPGRNEAERFAAIAIAAADSTPRPTGPYRVTARVAGWAAPETGEIEAYPGASLLLSIAADRRPSPPAVGLHLFFEDAGGRTTDLRVEVPEQTRGWSGAAAVPRVSADGSVTVHAALSLLVDRRWIDLVPPERAATIARFRMRPSLLARLARATWLEPDEVVRLEEAETVLLSAFPPERAEALGWIRAAMRGDDEVALRACRRALGVNPFDAGARLVWARRLATTGDDARALREYGRIAATPDAEARRRASSDLEGWIAAGRAAAAAREVIHRLSVPYAPPALPLEMGGGIRFLEAREVEGGLTELRFDVPASAGRVRLGASMPAADLPDGRGALTPERPTIRIDLRRARYVLFSLWRQGESWPDWNAADAGFAPPGYPADPWHDVYLERASDGWRLLDPAAGAAAPWRTSPEG